MQAIDGDESIGRLPDDDDDNWPCAAAEVITSSSVKLEQMYKLVVLRYQINKIGRNPVSKCVQYEQRSHMS